MSRVSVGVIVGIVAAIVAIIVVLALIQWWVKRKKAEKRVEGETGV